MATVNKGLRDPGWTNNLAAIPNISMSDVVSIIQKHSKVPNKHLSKGYKFFHGSYIHDISVKVNAEGCSVRCKCFRSMKKNETPWSIQITLVNTKELRSQLCGCGAGKGSCAHVAALVYQLAHYKTLKMKAVPDIISKTSCPQQWQVPPRTHGIKPRDLTDVKFVKPKANAKNSESCVCSTLYNPVNTEFPDMSLISGLQNILPLHDDKLQLLQVLPDNLEASVMHGFWSGSYH
ncbi:uncharacterized protein LOC128549168 [Mercenaria mercenaria]|uniref:uncharacterized protein LOC128549168 n=1 Tax=Mercenaria mercenaria TaxID=6596 RepID=UPI00234F59F6|nr:uncharacterized protein LOC128549168 [Mercenaria mercenaria]